MRGDLALDMNRFTTLWQGQRVDLSLTEFWIVHTLALHPGHVKSREQLMENAHIVVDDATREGSTFTFSTVQIDGNGWLVLHPFEDGKPNGDIYVGATYLTSGENRDVEVTVEEEPSTGDMFIVMLHRDVNENQEFDFVFVDSVNVLDKAVFEGRTMIGHAIAAP